MNEVEPLSNDINVITAEINAYQRVAGEAIFEIGYRLNHVKETDLTRGEWSKWCREKLGMDRARADKFIRVYEEFGRNESPATRLGLEVMYMIATMPEEAREQPHTIPSTGETKTVDEMTRNELREVKKSLKEKEQALMNAEARVELAERDAEDLRNTLESIEDKDPEVVTEYVEVERVVVDELASEKLHKYEEMFGDISIYEHGARRVSNKTDVMASIQMFSHDTRSLLKKYAYFEQYSRELNEMPESIKQEFKNSLEAVNNFVLKMASSLDVKDDDIIEAEIII